MAEIDQVSYLKSPWASKLNLSRVAKSSGFHRITYQDQNGKIRTWEGSRRTTRPKTSLVDAIHIVAILDKPTGPELLLEKQFRPPTGKVVIEFPAGLVDAGETPDQSAVRELAEETGYQGEVIPDRTGKRPIMYSCTSLQEPNGSPPELT